MKPIKTPFVTKRSNSFPSGSGWLAGLLGCALLTGVASAQGIFDNYDAAIVEDNAAGLTPTAALTTPVVLDGSAGSAFDFGSVSGDATIEFILEGDPSFNNSAFLAVGQAAASSLRYEVWDNTGELGFTLGGVADYQFSPPATSPTAPTHVAYVYDPAGAVMSVYVNGKLAGTTTGVGAAFVMPSGAGFLGANSTGGERMLGTIHRVTVYDSALDAATLRRHSDAFGGDVLPALAGYDQAVGADTTAGLTPTVQQTTTLILPSTGRTPFDFGANSDDVTMEFILKGDPSLNDSAFLAVGQNSRSSLRYELWQNTGQLGFTQGGVADYPFTPGVVSPLLPTHVTYAWNSVDRVMRVFINGVLSGTTSGVDPGFAMPNGEGYLGSNPSGTERMAGIVYRVTVYDDLLDEATIARHAKGFTDVLQPPLIPTFTTSNAHLEAGESATLNWTVQFAKTVTLNGTDRSGVTTLVVAPEVSTTYILKAVNDAGTAESKITVYVEPKLAAYDAAIAEDVAAGLLPAASLTEAVSFTGSGGSPFNFGPVSGDVAIEFIVEGDPMATVNSYLAVGENDRSNLRFEQWAETVQNGFTQLGVEDYLFTPPVPSSAWPTHLTYVWDSTALSMSIYVNGTLAGTAENISQNFAMPTGQGWLGANPGGGEALVGTIYRVTVYDDPPSPEVIERHGKAFLAQARPGLAAYDRSVSESAGSPAARLLAPVVVNGTAGVPFNFADTSGGVTMEFILQGDPTANNSAFLAVGANSINSLRYELWDNTGEIGFTLGGVADYQFVPGVPSPTIATHVAYVWQPDATTMSLFVNGSLAGTTTEVGAAFEMPKGLGWLGSAGPGATEPMVGTIHRATVYGEVLSAELILAHARSFLNQPTGPQLAISLTRDLITITLGQGTAGKHYRVETRASLSAGVVWELLTDIPSLTGTSIQIADPSPIGGRAQRYYRAVEVP